MGIKRYILLSIVFILVVGLYVYSLMENLATLTSKDMFTFPVAIWLFYPLLCLQLLR